MDLLTPTPSSTGPVPATAPAASGWRSGNGTDARLIYQSSNTIDTGQKEILYRRDLAFQAEWAVIQTMSASQVVLTSMVLEPTKDLLTPLDVIPIYS